MTTSQRKHLVPSSRHQTGLSRSTTFSNSLNLRGSRISARIQKMEKRTFQFSIFFHRRRASGRRRQGLRDERINKSSDTVDNEAPCPVFEVGTAFCKPPMSRIRHFIRHNIISSDCFKCKAIRLVCHVLTEHAQLNCNVCRYLLYPSLHDIIYRFFHAHSATEFLSMAAHTLREQSRARLTGENKQH
ncbi:hypothetical protein AVEN_131486-1 [Araneus ventricosus]|uniref:Uncharacterized protein n=1 Tax=Araneus ventricosus TaxID=182803 RepID=A0A4Y2UPV6_ARAVE|nr:hypothetical protein AVEN_131486-1 [Araneus ventricosus]